MMRVLVCGGREWTDADIIDVILAGFEQRSIDVGGGITIIEGQCPVGHGGADRIAERWAKEWGAAHLPFPAETKGGRFLGPERNQRMLDEGKPDVVIAFKDDFRPDISTGVVATDTPFKFKGGTEDMVRRAKAAGIPTYIVSHG